MERVDFAKHSGVSSYFRREYIRTGIFDTELSDIIREAFEVRGSSDKEGLHLERLFRASLRESFFDDQSTVKFSFILKDTAERLTIHIGERSAFFHKLIQIQEPDPLGQSPWIDNQSDLL